MQTPFDNVITIVYIIPVISRYVIKYISGKGAGI